MAAAVFRRSLSLSSPARLSKAAGTSALHLCPRNLSGDLLARRFSAAVSKRRRPKGYKGPILSYRTRDPPEFYKRIPFPADKRFLVRVYDRIFRESPFIIVYQHRSTQAQVDAQRTQLEPYLRLLKVKVTLARMAVWGTPLQDITGLFAGPTDLAFVEKPDVDIIQATKAFIASQKDEPSCVLGGVIHGRPVTRDMLYRLAAMPNEDHAVAELITVMNQPARSVVQVLNNPTTNLVKVLDFMGKSQGDASAAGDAAAAAEES